MAYASASLILHFSSDLVLFCCLSGFHFDFSMVPFISHGNSVPHHEGFSRWFYLSSIFWHTWCLIFHLSWVLGFNCLHLCKSVESTASQVHWPFVSCECRWDCFYSVLTPLASGPYSSSFPLITLTLPQATLMFDRSWLPVGRSFIWGTICSWYCQQSWHFSQDCQSSPSYHPLWYNSWAIVSLDLLWSSAWLFLASWWRFNDYPWWHFSSRQCSTDNFSTSYSFWQSFSSLYYFSNVFTSLFSSPFFASFTLLWITVFFTWVTYRYPSYHSRSTSICPTSGNSIFAFLWNSCFQIMQPFTATISGSIYFKFKSLFSCCLSFCFSGSAYTSCPQSRRFSSNSSCPSCFSFFTFSKCWSLRFTFIQLAFQYSSWTSWDTQSNFRFQVLISCSFGTATSIGIIPSCWCRLGSIHQLLVCFCSSTYVSSESPAHSCSCYSSCVQYRCTLDSFYSWSNQHSSHCWSSHQLHSSMASLPTQSW